jgi:hypothetical protein
LPLHVEEPRVEETVAAAPVDTQSEPAFPLDRPDTE